MPFRGGVKVQFAGGVLVRARQVKRSQLQRGGELRGVLMGVMLPPMSLARVLPISNARGKGIGKLVLRYRAGSLLV